MGPCFECGRPAEHRHHVIPKSRGGKKTIPLCAKCHSLAHDARGLALMKEGQARARAAGRRPGKPYKHSQEQFQQMVAMRLDGMPMPEIERRMGITHASLHVRLKRYAIEHNMLEELGFGSRGFNWKIREWKRKNAVQHNIPGVPSSGYI